LDLVHHGENGWLYPPDSPELMAQAVCNLASDPGRRRAMGDRARESVQHRTWKAIGDQLIAYYGQLLARPSRRELAA
jgi:phosphatidylinositol alpha 1,6-mannosyltransferase